MILSEAAAVDLCRRAALGAGAGPEAAASLASATVSAEMDGVPSVGFAHLIDYLAGFRSGRIATEAQPVITSPAPALILSDAGGGLAHLGYDRAHQRLAEAAKTFGVAIFSQRNAFTCGELGYFVKRLAAEGLVALAATNGPPVMAPKGVAQPVYCTNPMAFAAPGEKGAALVIDQSSSATAFVNIRRAAASGEPIPDHWAVGPEGKPTTDAAEAMRGALVAFGGARGANIALMVEVLAAGLSGANWSLDAQSFSEGGETPGTGLFVLAIAPVLFGTDFSTRLAAQLGRLADLGVHIPGLSRRQRRSEAAANGLPIDAALHATIESYAEAEHGT